MTNGFLANDAIDVRTFTTIAPKLLVHESYNESLYTAPGLPDLPEPSAIHKVYNPFQAQDLILKHMEYDRAVYKAIPVADKSGAKDGREHMMAEGHKRKALQELKAKYLAYGYTFTVPNDSSY